MPDHCERRSRKQNGKNSTSLAADYSPWWTVLSRSQHGWILSNVVRLAHPSSESTQTHETTDKDYQWAFGGRPWSRFISRMVRKWKRTNGSAHLSQGWGWTQRTLHAQMNSTVSDLFNLMSWKDPGCNPATRFPDHRGPEAITVYRHDEYAVLGHREYDIVQAPPLHFSTYTNSAIWFLTKTSSKKRFYFSTAIKILFSLFPTKFNLQFIDSKIKQQFT